METLLRVPAALIAIAQKRLRNLKLSTDRLEISIVGHLFGTIKGNWAVVLRLDFMHTSIVLVVAFLKLLAYLLDLLDRTLVIVCQLIRQFSSILDPLELAIGLGKFAVFRSLSSDISCRVFFLKDGSWLVPNFVKSILTT